MILRNKLFRRKTQERLIWMSQKVLYSTAPRDSEQIKVLGFQLAKRLITAEPFKRATTETSGLLMNNLDVANIKGLRHCSICSGGEPSVLCCSTNHLHLNKDEDKKELLNSWFEHEKLLVKSFKLKLSKEKKLICDYIFNVIKGNDKLKKCAL